MASGGNVRRSNRPHMKQYVVLVEVDYLNRHYIPNDLLLTAEWQQEHIVSALERRLVKEVEELPSVVSDGEEVTYGTSGSA